MKTNSSTKFLGLVALVVTLAVGCAAPQEEAAPAPAPTGPTAAESQQAIAEAKAALEKVDAVGYAWRDTGKLIKDAEAAAKEGKHADAIKLANKAREQAEDAYRQYLAEQERTRPLMVETEAAAADQYTVERGDNLWAISGMDQIYGNPYQWPLIYKANQDKIEDADLIYPGQVLDIDRNASASDVDAAVRHARTRGAWSLGTVEESDRAYLGR